MNLHADPRAPACATSPLRLDELIPIEREHRIPDLTLAARLGFARPHGIRKLIIRNVGELALHGNVVERPSTFLHRGEKSGRTGRPGTMWLLNEGQALVVCSLSRTPVAARVRQDVIAVYMAHRRGHAWVPPVEGERIALRHLAAFGTIVPAGEPVPHLGDTTGGVYACRSGDILIAPVTPAIVDVLSAFEADDLTEGDLELDGDVTDVPHDEIDEDGCEDGWDREPSLAAPERQNGGSQEKWAQGAVDDREVDLDLEESDGVGLGGKTADDEPTLGWPGIGTGAKIAPGVPWEEQQAYLSDGEAELDADREADPAEAGIADLDGLAEQVPIMSRPLDDRVAAYDRLPVRRARR